MDTVNKKRRSEIMASIRCSGNRSTEKALRATLVSLGIRGWVLTVRNILGKPDFVFPLARVAVFVDGCFWHNCPTCKRKWPKTNRKYWEDKIRGNAVRDRQIRNRLRRDGWIIVRIWEHEVKANPQKAVKKIARIAL